MAADNLADATVAHDLIRIAQAVKDPTLTQEDWKRAHALTNDALFKSALAIFASKHATRHFQVTEGKRKALSEVVAYSATNLPAMKKTNRHFHARRGLYTATFESAQAAIQTLFGVSGRSNIASIRSGTVDLTTKPTILTKTLSKTAKKAQTEVTVCTTLLGTPCVSLNPPDVILETASTWILVYKVRGHSIELRPATWLAKHANAILGATTQATKYLFETHNYVNTDIVIRNVVYDEATEEFLMIDFDHVVTLTEEPEEVVFPQETITLSSKSKTKAVLRVSLAVLEKELENT